MCWVKDGYLLRYDDEDDDDDDDDNSAGHTLWHGPCKKKIMIGSCAIFSSRRAVHSTRRSH